MLKVLSTQFKEELKRDLFNYYLDKMPHEIRQRILRYRRWEDQHAALLGKLLLLDGLKILGLKDLDLKDLKYTEYNRPYFDDEIDFNISHAGSRVLCAISDEYKLGIDIEQIIDIKLDDFVNQWTPAELEILNNSNDPLYQFYTFWTKKESLVKANGKGLSIPLNKISVIDHKSIVEGNSWHLIPLNTDENYVAHLSVSEKISWPLNISEMNYF